MLRVAQRRSIAKEDRLFRQMGASLNLYLLPIILLHSNPIHFLDYCRQLLPQMRRRARVETTEGRVGSEEDAQRIGSGNRTRRFFFLLSGASVMAGRRAHCGTRTKPGTYRNY